MPEIKEGGRDKIREMPFQTAQQALCERGANKVGDALWHVRRHGEMKGKERALSCKKDPAGSDQWFLQALSELSGGWWVGFQWVGEGVLVLLRVLKVLSKMLNLFWGDESAPWIAHSAGFPLKP